MPKKECVWLKKTMGQKDCKILSEMQCKKHGKCSFYETEEQYEERKKKYEEIKRKKGF